MTKPSPNKKNGRRIVFYSRNMIKYELIFFLLNSQPQKYVDSQSFVLNWVTNINK